MTFKLAWDLRPAERAEAANAARRFCVVPKARLRRDEPSRRMPAPALEDDVRQHVVTR